MKYPHKSVSNATIYSVIKLTNQFNVMPVSIVVSFFSSKITSYAFIYKHNTTNHLGRVKPIWYLSPMRAAKVQASLRIRAVSPEPPLLVHTSSESRGTFRQKATSLAPLNGWACAVKICRDGMLEDKNSLDAAHFYPVPFSPNTMLAFLEYVLTSQPSYQKGLFDSSDNFSFINT